MQGIERKITLRHHVNTIQSSEAAKGHLGGGNIHHCKVAAQGCSGAFRAQKAAHDHLLQALRRVQV